jgi:hypothetical protein
VQMSSFGSQCLLYPHDTPMPRGMFAREILGRRRIDIRDDTRAFVNWK